MTTTATLAWTPYADGFRYGDSDLGVFPRKGAWEVWKFGPDKQWNPVEGLHPSADAAKAYVLALKEGT